MPCSAWWRSGRGWPAVAAALTCGPRSSITARRRSPGKPTRSARPPALDDRGPVRSAQCVVVPLLLTAAYHSKSDIPAQLAAFAARSPALRTAAAGRPRCRGALRRHPRPASAAAGRAGAAPARGRAGVPVDSAADRARTGVVLAAAGSSDPAANATRGRPRGPLARRDRGWRAVVPAYALGGWPVPRRAPSPRCAPGAADPGRRRHLPARPRLLRGQDSGSGAKRRARPPSRVRLGAAPEAADVVLDRVFGGGDGLAR